MTDLPYEPGTSGHHVFNVSLGSRRVKTPPERIPPGYSWLLRISGRVHEPWVSLLSLIQAYTATFWHATFIGYTSTPGVVGDEAVW